MEKNIKPLGHKAYGHIPHFEGSRITPTDKKCEYGQQLIMTNKARDKKDLIIVQEKLDGSNCSVAKLDNQIYSLTRAGYEANTSRFVQHHYFAQWVEERTDIFLRLLKNGERIVGEWMMQAHGTIYERLESPYIVFDIMTQQSRMTYHNFLLRVLPFNFTIPRLIHIGQPYKLEWVKEDIKISGHGGIGGAEGCVYRCERENKVDFLCKYVRPDKKDGIYLPEISGGEPIWNYTF